MKHSVLIFALLVLAFGANNTAAQTDAPTAPRASRKDAAAAMSKLEMFVGSFDSASKLSDEQTGKQISEDTGKIVNRMRAGGFVFTIEKETVTTKGRYDDIMAFQFDARTDKIRAFLFSNDPMPREIAVEIKDNAMVLDYEPGINIITRETVTAEKDGGVRWLIEHKQADGSYRKTREIVATRQKQIK